MKGLIGTLAQSRDESSHDASTPATSEAASVMAASPFTAAANAAAPPDSDVLQRELTELRAANSKLAALVCTANMSGHDIRGLVLA